MSDDLLFLPTVPEPKPEDPEDVSWALSTAEAMWARGDHAEGIKWVRRAAEAASEAEVDGRALELAKAAADLAALISRRMTRASIDIEEIIEPTPTPPPVPNRPANKPPPAPATTAPKPITPSKQSRPPAPLPSRTSQPPPPTKQSQSQSQAPAPAPTKQSQPPAPTKQAQPPVSIKQSQPPAATKQSQPPAATKQTQPPATEKKQTSQPPGARSNSTKPLGTNTSAKPASLRPGALSTKSASDAKPDAKDSKKDAKKSARRSRDNVEADARLALGGANAGSLGEAVIDKTAAQVGSADTTETATVDIRQMLERSKRDNDVTVVGHVNDIKRLKNGPDEWDADSTQNLTGDDFPFSDGERKTAVGPPAAEIKAAIQNLPRPSPKGTAGAGGASKSAPPAGASIPPATVAGAGAQPNPSGSRPAERHDPGIVTSQAVRVVVWRDATGVHVAPAGTVVTAITVDAVLVALEPNADLTAWLTQKGRRP